uniref:Uncharacterized protein n=1 Tax=Anguilla anguilla TaxID=7936 RepID=A0A0E9TDJ7_ANGAN
MQASFARNSENMCASMGQFGCSVQWDCFAFSNCSI